MHGSGSELIHHRPEFRDRRDLLEPFRASGEFRELTVQHCEANTLEDSAWADFERDGDKDALATKHALFFSTIFAPTLAGALERSADPERRLAFLARLESGLKRRLADRRSRSTRASRRSYSRRARRGRRGL
jgi:hypothetical protein